MEREAKRHFVLVHGACHGAWCWFKVATLLESAGHTVTALDMAASGIHPKQVLEVNSITEYVEPLTKFVGSLAEEERVILVGHSMGGICIPMAMEIFPNKIAAAVFVNGFMPFNEISRPTLVQEESLKKLGITFGSKIRFDDSPENNLGGSMIFKPQFYASNLYQLSPTEDWTLGMSLVRPTRIYGDLELFLKETRVTRDNYGTVVKVCIVSDQDKSFPRDLQKLIIKLNPPSDVKVSPDADHMAMFSKPQELFSCLQDIANTYY